MPAKTNDDSKSSNATLSSISNGEFEYYVQAALDFVSHKFQSTLPWEVSSVTANIKSGWDGLDNYNIQAVRSDGDEALVSRTVDALLDPTWTAITYTRSTPVKGWVWNETGMELSDAIEFVVVKGVNRYDLRWAKVEWPEKDYLDGVKNHEPWYSFGTLQKDVWFVAARSGRTGKNLQKDTVESFAGGVGNVTSIGEALGVT